MDQSTQHYVMESKSISVFFFFKGEYSLDCSLLWLEISSHENTTLSFRVACKTVPNKTIELKKKNVFTVNLELMTRMICRAKY